MSYTTQTYSGWGRVLKAEGRVARPERMAALPGLMAAGEGALSGLGNRRSYGDAALNSGGRAILTTRLDRILGFDPETGMLEAEPGITLSEILAVFGPKGFMPPVMPGTGFATLGGAIANDVHGKNHHEAGSFGQHVESLDLIGADGVQRRCSAEAEPERFRATIGGLGLTGLIVGARLRLSPCPGPWVQVEERRMPDLDAFMDAFDASRASQSVGWIDATAGGRALGRGVLEEAEFSRDRLADPKPRKSSKVPFDAPNALLSAPVVRLFNLLYYRRIPAEGRSRARPLTDFLFPLDRIHDWNRLYGRRGFHQFQCVVPEEGAPEVLHSILSAIATAGLASPLAVLKRMGDGRAGLMSFPMKGWSLAVDFPARPHVGALVQRLEGLVLKAGGRIYLAKDALASPGAVAAMYPDLPAFRATLREIDPAGVFRTDLARRLGLVAA